MRNRWKLTAGILFWAVLLLTCAQAMAAGIQQVPASRIKNVSLPSGMVVKSAPVITNGKVKTTVDDDATDWTEVLMKAASRDHLIVSLEIAAPDGAVAGVRENFGSWDSETLDAIAIGLSPEWFDYQPESLPDAKLDGSAIFAELHFGETTYLDPVDVSGAGTILCWQMADGQKLYEYVQWEIEHTNPDLKEVKLPGLSKQMLSTVPSALPSGVNAVIENGGITCIFNDFSTLTALPIVINAP